MVDSKKKAIKPSMASGAPIRPVGTKLEFHGDTGGDTQGKVDAKQFAPKTRHVFPHFFACHHVHGFHDDQQPHHAQCEWYK